MFNILVNRQGLYGYLDVFIYILIYSQRLYGYLDVFIYPGL